MPANYLTFIVMILLSRFGLHKTGLSAMMCFSVFATLFASRLTASFLILSSLILSDFLLASFFNLPFLGSWSFFTYTGFFCITLLSASFQKRSFIFLITSEIAYWIWTNLGTWLCTHLYLHTASGLFQCYIAGLPFLKKALLSDVLFYPFFIFCAQFAKKKPTCTPLKANTA